MRRLVPYGIAVVVVFGGLQLLPFGHIDNPPVSAEPAWPSPQVRQLAVRACFDCHSNETSLEWFDRVAPASWIVADHVKGGRQSVNFSEWDRRQRSDDLDDLDEVVEDGDMPPRDYVWLHREAKLSEAEKQTLIQAFTDLPEAGEGGADEGGSGRNRGPGGGDDG